MVDDQPILDADNYALDNAYGVQNFVDNKKDLIKLMLDEEAIEDLKTYLKNQKKSRSMRIDNYTRQTKMLNNYTPWIDKGVAEREMIKQVILKRGF